jgi:Domain of unknown function (DUF4340)
MRWRQVLLLYVVAAVLAADYLRGPAAAPGPPTTNRPVRPRVLALDPATLSEVAIVHAGRRVVARRDGDGWTIEEPAGANVPGDLVKAFVTTLVEAEEIERVGSADDLAAFGLDDAATRLELRPSGGPPETLWLGGTNPSGTAVYARRMGAHDVILVGRTLRYYEELLLQALPAPAVPADTRRRTLGDLRPLTSRRSPV